jgi:hypothetical protein
MVVFFFLFFPKLIFVHQPCFFDLPHPPPPFDVPNSSNYKNKNQEKIKERKPIYTIKTPNYIHKTQLKIEKKKIDAQKPLRKKTSKLLREREKERERRVIAKRKMKKNIII